jgi:hypothetical protein
VGHLHAEHIHKKAAGYSTRETFHGRNRRVVQPFLCHAPQTEYNKKQSGYNHKQQQRTAHGQHVQTSFFPLSDIPGQYFVHSSVSFPAEQLLYFNSMSVQELIEQKIEERQKKKVR